MQVVADIATAIDESAAAGVAHRDITPNNFGHIGGRGILYDYSAGKVSAGHCIVICWGDPQNLCNVPLAIVAHPCEHRTLAMPLQGTRVPWLPPQLSCMATACVSTLEIDLMALSLRCTGRVQRRLGEAPQ